MKYSLGQIVEFLRPNEIFFIEGEEITFENSDVKIPTKKEIADGEAKMIKEASEKAAQQEVMKSAIIDKLGLTADEAKILFG